MARKIKNMGIYLSLVSQLGKAMAIDRYDYILALYVARYAGLRIHECFRIDTAIAEHTLRENAITTAIECGSYIEPSKPLDSGWTLGWIPTC